MASVSTGIRVSLASLSPRHLMTVKHAISKILSTPLAFETYALVLDGMPTREVFLEYNVGGARSDILNRLEPSSGAKELLEAYRSELSVETLQTDAKTAQAYQNSVPGSHEHALRLIEIVCVICHDIAASLFESVCGGLQEPDINRPRTPLPEPSDDEFPDMRIPLVDVPPKPTLLYHASYLNHEEYPHGTADIVGYWAEYRLFGGVVLFDRERSGEESDGVFLHPVRSTRIFQLSAAQIDRLIEFFESDDPIVEVPLPMKSEKGVRRMRSYESMSQGIYRDAYERKVPTTPPRRCVYMFDENDEEGLQEQYDQLATARSHDDRQGS